MNTRSSLLPPQLPRGLCRRMISPPLLHPRLSARETAGDRRLGRRYDFCYECWVTANGYELDFQPPLPTVIEPYDESGNDPHGEGGSIGSASSVTSATLWPSPDLSPKVPPSPTTPLPVPTRTIFGAAHSPMPVSPRPFSARPSDLPGDSHHHQRSRSETLPAIPGTRHLRRRPMLLDDRSHLSRLSTLIESNNVTGIENFSRSPVVTESFDAFHRVALQSPALRTGRTKTPNRETMGPPPSATLSSASSQTGRRDRVASTWFLRPTYGDDDIDLDYDGTVIAGTLSALMERLTLDYLSTFARHRLHLLTKV